MARSAKEIFLARGYTEAEIAAMPIMSDARFTGALEAEEAERERISQDLTNTTEWYHKKAKPAMTKLAEDAVAAKAEAARLKAELEARQSYGLSQVAQNQAGGQGGNQSQTPASQTPPQTPAQTPNFDASRYVDQETFNGFGAQMGHAIAVMNDLEADYRDLFGARLPGGAVKLREEYVRGVNNHTIPSGVDLDTWARQKFNFDGKRAELSAAARAKEISDAVAAERVKWASEQGNPMTRTGVSSRSPFAGKRAVNGTIEGGHQPWEKTDAQRSSERIFKVVQKQAERGVA